MARSRLVAVILALSAGLLVAGCGDDDDDPVIERSDLPSASDLPSSSDLPDLPEKSDLPDVPERSDLPDAPAPPDVPGY